MTLQQKIEAEIVRLEKELQGQPVYQEITFLKEKIDSLQKSYVHSPTYQILQTLKNLLTETSTQDYKILEIDRLPSKRGKISKQLNLKDTSHYKEMLDFIEAHLELYPEPFEIMPLYEFIVSAGYEVGGKKPAYTLSAILSKDSRFTPTNKGWVLTKKVNADAIQE